jgi:Cys-tRNA(Pro) deacylase
VVEQARDAHSAQPWRAGDRRGRATFAAALSRRLWLDRGMSAPAPSVVAALDAAGLDYRVLVHTAPVRSLAEAAAARGVDVIDVIKTLVVRRGDGDYLFVLVPGGRQISWPKLRTLLGVSRMSMPPAPEAFEATGFERGTITPLGSSSSWPVVADLIVAERGEITLGSGVHEVAIAVDAKALLEATAATVADVTDPE